MPEVQPHKLPPMDFSSSHDWPFALAESDTFGRHLVATRDIQPSEVILIDDPAVVGPATKNNHVCIECCGHLPDSCPVLCPGCGFEMCSDHGDLRFHDGQECSYLAKSSLVMKTWTSEKRSLFMASIFIARMLSIKKNNPPLFERTFFLMQGNTSDLTGEGSFGMEMVAILQDHLGQQLHSVQDMIRCQGIKRTNANSMDSIGRPGGAILYPTYPLINHSCCCNSSCVIDPKSLRIKVVAQKLIKRGQQITTRYLSPWDGEPLRMAKIWQNWHFVCRCDRCEDVSDLGVMFSAIRCMKCPGYLLPETSGFLGSPWKCQSCAFHISHSGIVSLLEVAESSVSNCSGRSRDFLELLRQSEELVGRLEATKLHPNHFLIYRLKKHIIEQSCKVNTASLELPILEKLFGMSQFLGHLEAILDPALTMTKAQRLKTNAQLRLDLAKKTLAIQGPGYSEEFRKQAGLALEELKQMNVCLKFHSISRPSS